MPSYHFFSHRNPLSHFSFTGRAGASHAHVQIMRPSSLHFPIGRFFCLVANILCRLVIMLRSTFNGSSSVEPEAERAHSYDARSRTDSSSSSDQRRERRARRRSRRRRRRAQRQVIERPHGMQSSLATIEEESTGIFREDTSAARGSDEGLYTERHKSQQGRQSSLAPLPHSYEPETKEGSTELPADWVVENLGSPGSAYLP